ncbi:MAG: HAD family hydrolase [Caldisericaceae bacterium]|nr:HAD family hydrolase [Caldisericaceae bacterium]
MKEQRESSDKKKITIFLDRDGVINEKAPEGDYIKSPEELKLIEGAAEAIKYFNDKGFLVIIITNQRGIGKGVMTKEDFEKVMNKLRKELAKKGAHIDAYYYCPDTDENSPCRKPNIGMFLQAKKDFPEINFRNSFVIGDSLKDIKAGKKIGAKTILLCKKISANIESDYTAECLSEIIRKFEKYES